MDIKPYNEFVIITNLSGYSNETFLCDGEHFTDGNGFRMYEKSLARQIYDNNGKPFDMKKLSKEERDKVIPLIKQGGREQDYLFLTWDEPGLEKYYEKI